MARKNSTPSEAAPPGKNPYLAAFLAWLLPGGGHLYLDRRARGLAFLVIVLSCVWIGCTLEGKLYTWSNIQPVRPMAFLGLLDAMALGVSYFLLAVGVGYQGSLTSPGYEYGTAFLITAGLMNVLLILDAWDIAHGRERSEHAPRTEGDEENGE